MRETSPVKLRYNTPAHTKRKINKCNSRVWTWFLLYLLTLARSENKTIVLFCAGILLRYGQLFSITIPDQKRFMRYFPILYHFIVNYTLVISISEMPAGHARLERELVGSHKLTPAAERWSILKIWRQFLYTSQTKPKQYLKSFLCPYFWLYWLLFLELF